MMVVSRNFGGKIAASSGGCDGGVVGGGAVGSL